MVSVRPAPRTPPARHRAPVEVEVLGDRDRGELTRLVDDDPIVNSVVSSRLRALSTLEPRTFGGLLLGVRDERGALCGAVFSGGNLLPIGGTPDGWRMLAAEVASRDRVCSSIVGPAPAVEEMWRVLRASWAPARAIRPSQPLLVIDRAAMPDAHDHSVRVMRPADLPHYLPAAAAMFTEELGVSPHEATGVGDYRRRVAGLIQEGRAFGLVDGDGSVIFKADIGAVSPHTCQVQGVWVRPDRRGQGIGRGGLATVLRHGLTLAPTVSLYVNDFNVPARRMYERLGLRETAVLSTILF